MATRSNERLRYRYGICLNDNCPKCKEKEVQQIPARKEFVCTNPECGKPLRECPPPPKGIKPKLIGGIVAALVVIGGGAGAFFAMGGEEEKVPEKKQPAVEVVDTTAAKPVAEEAAPAPAEKAKPEAPAPKEEKTATAPAKTEKAEKPSAPKTVQNGRGTVNLGYGSYSGELRNGKPDGAGVLTFKSHHKAGRNFKTGEDVYGEPGETVDGVFSNGFLQVGTISKKDGNVIKIKY